MDSSKIIELMNTPKFTEYFELFVRRHGTPISMMHPLMDEIFDMVRIYDEMTGKQFLRRLEMVTDGFNRGHSNFYHDDYFRNQCIHAGCNFKLDWLTEGRYHFSISVVDGTAIKEIIRSKYYYLSTDFKGFFNKLDKGYVMELTDVCPVFIMKKDDGYYLIESDRCRYVETDKRIITSRNSAPLNLSHHKATRIPLITLYKLLMKHTWTDRDGDVFLHSQVAEGGLYLYDALRLLDMGYTVGNRRYVHMPFIKKVNGELVCHYFHYDPANVYYPFKWTELESKVIHMNEWFIVTDYFTEWESDRIAEDVQESMTWFLCNCTPATGCD